MNDYLSTAQVAKMLGLNVHTIRRLVKQGKLKGYYISQHKIRIAKADLDLFLINKTTSPEELKGHKDGEI